MFYFPSRCVPPKCHPAFEKISRDFQDDVLVKLKLSGFMVTKLSFFVGKGKESPLFSVCIPCPNRQSSPIAHECILYDMYDCSCIYIYST